MNGVEKGLTWTIVIIVVGLAVAYVFNINLKVEGKTEPTYKIGDVPANAFKSSMEKFPVKGK